jgi:hypothetical protein
MNIEFLNKKVSSINVILSSIETDYYVYKWFLFLVGTPEIKAQLSQQKGTTSCYSSISAVTVLQILLYGVFLICTWYIFLIRQYYLLWFYFLFVGAGWCLFFFKRKYLVKLASFLLKSDFPEGEIGNITLYQLSEDYSKKLSIASVVDTIYASETTLRATFKISFICTVFIFMFRIWNTFFLVALSLVLVFFLSNSIQNYKRLK